MPTRNYLVRRRIFHRGDQRLYEAGETVKLAHLDKDAVDRLVALGAVELATNPPDTELDPAAAPEPPPPFAKEG